MIPIWVYVVVAGIIFSAIMALKTGREEREEELRAIEEEGEVYIKRMEQARENQPS